VAAREPQRALEAAAMVSDIADGVIAPRTLAPLADAIRAWMEKRVGSASGLTFARQGRHNTL